MLMPIESLKGDENQAVKMKNQKWLISTYTLPTALT